MDSIDQVLPPEEDSLSLSLLRARATRVMLECIRQCNPSRNGVPIALSLNIVDDPMSTNVTISLREDDEKNGLDSPQFQLACQITTTPRWIECATENQIKAVVAHEIAHAVNGDLHSPSSSAWARILSLCGDLLWVLLPMALAMNVLFNSIIWAIIGAVLLLLAVYSVWMSSFMARRSREAEYDILSALKDGVSVFGVSLRSAPLQSGHVCSTSPAEEPWGFFSYAASAATSFFFLGFRARLCLGAWG